MKTLDNIFSAGRTPVEIMTILRSQKKDCPTWDELEKVFDTSMHDIVADPRRRPKEKTKNGQTEKPAKLTYGAEKIATRRMTQMAFSIPVERVYSNAQNDEEKAFQDAIEAVYKSVRINGVNMNRMYAYFASCEAMTFWYMSEGDEVINRYGFDSNVKIRCRSFSPMPKKFSKIAQASIYPYFDEDEDLIALSVEYIDSENVRHFNSYTAKNAYYFTQSEDGGGWVMEAKPNMSGKIPAAYIQRPLPIYDGISGNRDDIEFTLSRNSDTIRKNQAPILKIKGEIIGGELPVGDTARQVYRVTEGGDVGLISPALTTSDAKAHIQILKQLNDETVQQVDLSMENVKGLGAQSGEARKTLLTEPHLKTKEESHSIIWFFDREFEVLKSLLVIAKPEWKKYQHTTTCEHVITPFIQNDTTTDITNYSKAAGVLMSQKSAIKRAGLVDDAEAEYEEIRKEKEAEAETERMVNVFEGAE